MQHILVTGGGYLGSVIANYLLANEYKVTVLDNYMRPMSDFMLYLNRFSNYNFIKMDIRDKKLKDALKDVDIVVHTAALSGQPLCDSNPSEAWSVNVDGTENILYSKQPDAKIIFHSSGSAYGKVKDICTETTPTNPQSLYASTKLDAEELLLGNSPQSVIVYRFSTAYGLSGLMRTNLLLNDLCYQAICGQTLTIFQPDFRRSFIHTSDIAYAILAGIENFNAMSGEIFNIGNKNGNWSKRQCAEYIKSLTGCHVEYRENGYIDPDQRDYEISFEKIKPFWEAKVSMETGLAELVKGLKTLYEPSKYR